MSTSTVKKSIPAKTAIWDSMNSRQVVFWLRFGAGSMPCRRRHCRPSDRKRGDPDCPALSRIPGLHGGPDDGCRQVEDAESFSYIHCDPIRWGRAATGAWREAQLPCRSREKLPQHLAQRSRTYAAKPWLPVLANIGNEPARLPEDLATREVLRLKVGGCYAPNGVGAVCWCRELGCPGAAKQVWTHGARCPATPSQ